MKNELIQIFIFKKCFFEKMRSIKIYYNLIEISLNFSKYSFQETQLILGPEIDFFIDIKAMFVFLLNSIHTLKKKRKNTTTGKFCYWWLVF